MQAPTMIGARQVAPDTISLSSYCPLPGLGILPVNAFVIEAAQPVLVDTGLSALRGPSIRKASAGSGSAIWTPITSAIWKTCSRSRPTPRW
jgi:hypothetical protein